MDAKKGFTLIELLIVIAIIGILASTLVVNVMNGVQRARDGRRLNDMRQIQNGIRLYLTTYGRYPGTVASYGEGSSCGGWDTSRLDSDGDGLPFLEPLIGGDLMSNVPRDPRDTPGTSCGGYDYYRYSAGTYGCDVSRGDFFVLGVRDMESTGRPHPSSPGWNCPARNWQTEFDWVIGGFTL